MTCEPYTYLATYIRASAVWSWIYNLRDTNCHESSSLDMKSFVRKNECHACAYISIEQRLACQYFWFIWPPWIHNSKSVDFDYWLSLNLTSTFLGFRDSCRHTCNTNTCFFDHKLYTMMKSSSYTRNLFLYNWLVNTRIVVKLDSTSNHELFTANYILAFIFINLAYYRKLAQCVLSRE